MTTPLVFTAELGTKKSYNSGPIIKFSRILANFGNMYNRRTGIVTVPQHGVYSISVRLASAAKTESSVLSFESRFPPPKLSIWPTGSSLMSPLVVKSTNI